jgi:biotin carboxyl carrier protein
MAVTQPSESRGRRHAGEGASTEAADDAARDAGRDAARAVRDHARSLRDHEAINRLADDLLPALIARLSSSGLGEIEVREGSWKARLRKPVTVERRSGRVDDHRAHAPAATRAGTSGLRDDRDRHPADASAEDELGVIVARSPAVGVFTPRRDLVLGMRVRSGDRIGFVDVLGVQQEVLSPIDGVIGSSLAEAGEAVEYGQELVRIDVPGSESVSSRPGMEKASAAAAVVGRS